jgi:PAS domain S-box-containing protein
LESWFLAAAFVILVVTSISAWQNSERIVAIRAAGRAARDSIDELEIVIAGVREAEASQRGFLLTGEDSYLEPFNRAVAALKVDFDKIRSAAPKQAAAINNLQSLVNAKVSEMNATIGLRRVAGTQPALKLVLTDQGWELMERIRQATRNITAVETEAYRESSVALSRLGNQILYVSLGGDLVLCVLLFLAALSMNAGAERREELIAALREDDRRLRDLREKAQFAEERVRSILESIGDGFISVDREWNITYCNAEAARILGRSIGDMLGKSFWNEFPDASTPELEASFREAEQARKPHNFQSFIKTRNSYWEQNLYPSQEGWSVFFRDVTERRRFEERTRHAHKLESLGILAGGIAHDFNNLLTAILGSASLIQEELDADSPVRPLAENIIHASERASQLTRQMLAYSGRGRFIVEPIDIAQQVKEISALLESSITAQVQLILDLRTDGIFVDADSSQIQQLIMNLVINGAEAIGSMGGRVVVSTRLQHLDSQFSTDNLAGDNIEPGPFILLEVHDTGAGMDQATLSRIFDPFFTTKFTGRGLGLAAVLGIVRGHRGAIKVYSNPGRGTTFKVYFPVSSGQVLPKPVAAAIDPHGDSTVLVVDDEEVVQKLARSTLERYGYHVLIASNGKEALEMVECAAGEISLVLLDMTMPIMAGEETLAHLKSVRPDLKVIASSGYNEVEALRRFGDGVAGFLQKPYRASQLVEKVKLTLLQETR